MVGRVQLFVIPRTGAHQDPLSMGFPRKEYRSGMPFPSPGDLPNPGTEPLSPILAGGFFTAKSPGKPHIYVYKSFSTMLDKGLRNYNNKKRWINQKT